MTNHREALQWRIDVALMAGLLVAMLISPLADFGARCAQVRGEVLRLHILANSDTPEDQALKLRVRDAVLADAGAVLGSADTLAQAEAITRERLPRIQEVAQAEVLRSGQQYPVEAQLVRMYFDTRTYGEETLPAGEYEALRLTIGEAQGHNWWCVMFPPICVPAAAQALPAQGAQAQEGIRVLNSQPNYKMAFASVELLESLLQKTEAPQP